jgi:hypothetical protein
MLIQNQITIRRVLSGNAITSGLFGLLLLVDSGLVARFLGLDSPTAVLIVGLVALAYAALLAFNLRRPAIRPSFVLFTVIGDSTWVLVSILLLVTGWAPLSISAKWAIGIAAALVDVFATLQFLEWRKMG